jgi:hypothetical protein
MRPLQVLRSVFVSICIVTTVIALCGFAAPAAAGSQTASGTTGTTTTGTTTTGTTATTTTTTTTAEPVFSVTQNQKEFAPKSVYNNAITVKALDNAGKSAVDAPFQVVVITGDARVSDGDKVGSSLPSMKTGNDGTKSFSILTGERPDFEINVIPLVNNAPQVGKTIPIQLTVGPRYEDALSSNRAYAQLFMGQTFANNYDDSGNSTGFGSTGQQIAITFDTMWKRPSTLWTPVVPPSVPPPVTHPGLFHTELYMAFNQFPFGTAAKPATPATGGNSGTPATDAKPAPLENAFTGSLGIIWQPDKWASYSNTSRDEKLKFDAVRWGIFSRAGFTTRGKKVENGDSAIGRFQVGIRFTHHHTTVDTAAKEAVNYIPVRFVELSYAYYEQFQGVKNHSMLIVDGGIRLTPVSNNVIPFYAGFHAAVGPGPDDIRVVAGFLFKLDKLAELIKSPEGQMP